jgi:hypothetical protein
MKAIGLLRLRRVTDVTAAADECRLPTTAYTRCTHRARSEYHGRPFSTSPRRAAVAPPRASRPTVAALCLVVPTRTLHARALGVFHFTYLQLHRDA